MGAHIANYYAFSDWGGAASLAALEREATVLEAELNDVKARLESLKLEERDDSDEVNGDATLGRSQ